ncbi:hypothetical protein MMYC01_206676 [Madurella mycetomatis]|uniref:Uncharacterized protein n=1 Tax=Madurella mycetomatis TaxID=100816 RepID=A0A175VZ26_9PEZI|nr:hypothetical protein MMYC01_206676 [Madurella mycetomatis]
MASERSPQKPSQKTERAAHVIELSSDSEPDVHQTEDEVDDVPEEVTASPVINDQPLLRAAGIRYQADTVEEEPEEDSNRSPSNAKLAVRVKDTGSAKHRHVSIEIPLPTSSELRRGEAEASVSATGNQDGNDEDVFKTPMEKRQHITFDDSEHEEFITPKEDPSANPLESSIARQTKAKIEADGDEEEEEESDDDAPPEAVSTRAAEAQTLKAAEAAAKAAEQQAAAAKRKRQERDAFFRQQAEERKRAQRPAESEDEADGASPSAQEAILEHPEKRKREVMKLLPLELLESDDERDTPQRSSPAVDGKHKRRKLAGAEQSLLREPQLPRDQRVGSTVFRVVAGNGNTKLAPKVKQQSRNMKETLLRRDRVAQPRGGFFVKKR